MNDYAFRAWDEHFKKYFYSRDMGHDWCALGPFWYSAMENEWHIVEQFTGRKDITGGELYEGDAVVFETVETVRRHNGEHLRGVIVWQEKGARFGIRVAGRRAPMPLAQINLTKIGSVRENPALEIK